MKANIFASALLATVLTASASFAHTEPTDDKTTAKAAATVQVAAYRTIDNKIRVNIQKAAPVRAALELRNADGVLLYAQNIGRNLEKVATNFDVSDLEDGVYELRVVSNRTTYSQKVTIKTPSVQPSRIVAVN